MLPWTLTNYHALIIVFCVQAGTSDPHLFLSGTVREQTWTFLSTIVLGTILLALFCKNPNNFIGIVIGCILYF